MAVIARPRCDHRSLRSRGELRAREALVVADGSVGLRRHEQRVVAETVGAAPAPAAGDRASRPCTTKAVSPGAASARAQTNSAPRRSSGTSRSCASSRALLASSSPCTPDHLADSTPGMPFSASTAEPGVVGERQLTRRGRGLDRFHRGVVGERGAGLRLLGKRSDVVETEHGHRLTRGCAAARPASSRCGWRAARVPAARSAPLAALMRQLLRVRLVQGLLLQAGQGGDPDHRDVDHRVQRRPGEGGALAGALHLDQGADLGRDDIHVDAGPRVLLVGQVEPDPTVDDTDRDGGDLAGQRIRVGQPTGDPQEVHRVGQRDVRAGDRRRAGAAVGLQHVAVERDGVLAERGQVDAGPQRPADQPGDLVGTPADPTTDRLPVAAFVGRGRQHGVLGGEPAEPRPLAPAGHPAGDRGRAQHLGAAELDQDGSGRVRLIAAGECDRAQLVVGPSVCSRHAARLVGPVLPGRRQVAGSPFVRPGLRPAR